MSEATKVWRVVVDSHRLQGALNRLTVACNSNTRIADSLIAAVVEGACLAVLTQDAMPERGEVVVSVDPSDFLRGFLAAANPPIG